VSKESVTSNTLKLSPLLVGSENHFGSAGAFNGENCYVNHQPKILRPLQKMVSI
jgi:hypothetical protein